MIVNKVSYWEYEELKKDPVRDGVVQFKLSAEEVSKKYKIINQITDSLP